MERQAGARHRRAAGFTLVETLVALAIVTTGALMLAALALQTTDMVGRGRRHAVAAVLADAAVSERLDGGGTPNSPACLTRDVDGCVEYRDAGGAAVPGPSAPFAVRWHAASLGASPVPAKVLTVCAVPEVQRAPAARPAGVCVVRVVMERWP